MINKIIKIISLILIQVSVCQAQTKNIEKADSLFNTKNYELATKYYEEALGNHSENEINISLKLAYLAEQKENIKEFLYYLNYRYNLSQDDAIFDKLTSTAQEYKLKGYERSDFNFIILLFQNYYYYILFFFIFILFIILTIFYKKSKSNLIIPLRQKIIIGLYLLFLIITINLSSVFKTGVVFQTSNFRSFPSHGAAILGEIGEGNKINIFGEDETWFRVLWNKKVVFLNKNNVKLLP